MDYLYDCQSERYAAMKGRSLVRLEELKSSSHKNATVLPARKTDGMLFGRGGVLDANGLFLDSSSLKSRNIMLSYPKNNSADTETLFGGAYELQKEKVQDSCESIVYLGFVTSHWGHWLIDFCTRLWYLLENPDSGCGIFVVREGSGEQLIEPVKRFLELLDLGDKVRLIDKPMRFDEVVIPQESYVTNDYYSRQYTDMFDKVAKAASSGARSFDKVYLSRLEFAKAQGSEFGEEMIADAFERAGYMVVSPEKMSLDEQIALVRDSKAVAGISGTVMHNLLFARYGQKATVINKSYILNMMQDDIAQMRRLDLSYVDAYESPYPVRLGYGPFLLADTSQFESWAIKELGHGVSEQFMRPSYITNNLKKYNDAFRGMLGSVYSQEFEFHDRSHTHYYDSWFLEEGFRRHYRQMYPLRNSERAKLVWSKIVRKAKRILTGFTHGGH